ncbi:MAG: hypothetical protein BWX80_02508 [Candidatus Hydrogenedentes bacterium ADurb.Bin101]|nr:MAG: hypothetical protein BWX80_02508 [Candidatus Hydrogenedentes bacterium ADurb.Bin101]
MGRNNQSMVTPHKFHRLGKTEAGGEGEKTINGPGNTAAGIHQQLVAERVPPGPGRGQMVRQRAGSAHGIFHCGKERQYVRFLPGGDFHARNDLKEVPRNSRRRVTNGARIAGAIVITNGNQVQFRGDRRVNDKFRRHAVVRAWREGGMDMQVGGDYAHGAPPRISRAYSFPTMSKAGS